MKFLVTVMIGCLLPLAIACAVTPLQDYVDVRARDMAVANRDDGRSQAARSKAEAIEVPKLQSMVRSLVGPVKLPGFLKLRDVTPTTLQPDPGADSVDGLNYETADEKTTATVSTTGLVDDWLRRARAELADSPNPKDVPANWQAALRSKFFYTAGLGGNSAASLYGELPVALARPGTGNGFDQAIATLALYSQDTVGSETPDTLLVAVVRADKVYLFSKPARRKVGQIPVCLESWKRGQVQVKRLNDAHDTGRQRDQSLFDQADALQDKNDAAFQSCFRTHLPEQPYFSALTREAQSLVDLVP